MGDVFERGFSGGGGGGGGGKLSFDLVESAMTVLVWRIEILGAIREMSLYTLGLRTLVGGGFQMFSPPCTHCFGFTHKLDFLVIYIEEDVVKIL